MKSFHTLHSPHLHSKLIWMFWILALIMLLIFMFPGRASGSEQVIYTFAGGNDGSGPNALIADKAGNLFGTTFDGGGSSGAGTVFELSPQKGGGWTETILYSFSNDQLQNGIGPKAGLVMDSFGDLFGTTWLGGPNGGGEVFELFPPTQPGEPWSFNIIYDFSAPNDGYSPEAPLTIDAAGNLYGTTSVGGTGQCIGGCGTVFMLTPPNRMLGGGWGETILFNFAGSATLGGGTLAGVILDVNGAVYGTTSSGSGGKFGTVFKLTPPAQSGKRWTHTVLYAFKGKNDGLAPASGIVFDASGNLYGTTQYGGSSTSCFGQSCGTVFELTPAPSGQWTHNILYTFAGGNDGGNPASNVLFNTKGNLYGTTLAGGGSGCSGTGCGTVFRLRPLGGTWKESVLHAFTDGSDGAGPGGLALGKGSQLYGVAGAGANNAGLVFTASP